jgi:UDP-N-acetylmuramoyl-tripeptide--D-alanyl-D-alanine ligase
MVSNTEKAYQKIATWHRQSHSPKVIAITGSNGKTSTKNMLHSILSLHDRTLSTKGNLNNHLGVPTTILQLTKEHQYCVVEMGANHQNEIKLLCDIAKPDISVITNANNAHLGEFGSVEKLVKAKGEIYQSLDSKGVSIINNDSPHLQTWIEMSNSNKFLFFGTNSNIFADNIHQREQSIDFNLHLNGDVIDINLAMIGLHQIENALAASACAHELDVDLLLIKKGLENSTSEKGRLNLIECNNFTVLDDSYNANPQSMKVAIDTLQTFKGKKIAVLGSMAELGESSERLHQEVGDYARQTNLDFIFTIGKDAKHYQGQNFPDIESLYRHLRTNHLGATILIKGSRMMELDRLVDIIQKQ